MGESICRYSAKAGQKAADTRIFGSGDALDQVARLPGEPMLFRRGVSGSVPLRAFDAGRLMNMDVRVRSGSRQEILCPGDRFPRKRVGISNRQRHRANCEPARAGYRQAPALLNRGRLPREILEARPLQKPLVQLNRKQDVRLW
jgi:hypothetical protein